MWAAILLAAFSVQGCAGGRSGSRSSGESGSNDPANGLVVRQIAELGIEVSCPRLWQLDVRTLPDKSDPHNVVYLAMMVAPPDGVSPRYDAHVTVLTQTNPTVKTAEGYVDLVRKKFANKLSRFDVKQATDIAVGGQPTIELSMVYSNGDDQRVIMEWVAQFNRRIYEVTTSYRPAQAERYKETMAKIVHSIRFLER